MTELKLSSLLNKLEEELNEYKIKCKDYESVILTKDKKIEKLKAKLYCKEFECNFFKKIIDLNTNIKTEEIYKFTDQGINLNNFPDGNIPIIVNSFLEEPQKYLLNIKKKKKKGQTFRTVKTNLVTQDCEKNSVQTKDSEENKNSQVTNDIETKDCTLSVKTTLEGTTRLFSEIEKNRNYKKFLCDIKNNRNKLLNFFSLPDYISTVKSDIIMLEKIFEKKKYDSKKIQTNILLSLTPLEQRLVYYNNYYYSQIESDDIQKFNRCLEKTRDFSQNFIPFIQNDIAIHFCNYSLCFSTIKDIAKRIFNNPYKISNLVYLKLENENLNDPYRFYSLEKIQQEKRFWKMECRLFEISRILSEHIKNYSICLFRKIYYDIFNDNIYRDDYLDKYPITHQDCEQLLINIIYVTCPKKFCEIIQKTIIQYCAIQPTKNDKFNFTRDDQIIKKNFYSETNISISLNETIMRIFDGISAEKSEQIWQSRLN